MAHGRLLDTLFCCSQILKVSNLVGVCLLQKNDCCTSGEPIGGSRAGSLGN